MSVQYYTLASQAGEPEADMALSKVCLTSLELNISASCMYR